MKIMDIKYQNYFKVFISQDLLKDKNRLLYKNKILKKNLLKS